MLLLEIRKNVGLLFIFVGTILIGLPILLVMFNFIQGWDDVLITIILALPGALLLYFGFKWYDEYTMIKTPIDNIDRTIELSMINVVRIAAKLEVIISRLFRVIMFVASMLGMLSVIFWAIFLDGDNDLSNVFSGLFFGISFILLVRFMLNLRTNGHRLSIYLQPLDQNQLELSN